jgi:hypothetical protein
MSPRFQRISAGTIQPEDVIRRPEEIAKEVLPAGVQNFMGLRDQEGDATFGEFGQVRQRPIEEPRRLVLGRIARRRTGRIVSLFRVLRHLPIFIVRRII